MTASPGEGVSSAKSSRAKQGDRSREGILDAAIDLFSRRGYLGVSLDEIAKKSGTKRSLILYHFKSKIELWRQATARAAGEFEQAVGRKLAALPQHASDTESTEVVGAWVDAFVENQHYPRMLVLEGTAPGPRLDWLIGHFSYAEKFVANPQPDSRLRGSVFRDALMGIFLSMSALGPLMEASFANLSGVKNVGLYPMTKERRDELVNLLTSMIAAFEH